MGVWEGNIIAATARPKERSRRGWVTLQIPHASVLSLTQIKPSHPEDGGPSTVGRGRRGEFYENRWAGTEGHAAVRVCLEPFLNPFCIFQ